MTDDIKDQPVNEPQKRIFSRENMKGYLIIFMAMMSIILLYQILTGIQLGPINGGPPGGNPPGFRPAIDSLQFGGAPGGIGVGMGNIWPLWGTISLPTFAGFVIGLLSVFLAAIVIWYTYERLEISPNWLLVGLFGFVLIVLTNMINGWTVGIYDTIGAASEIYQDIPNVVSIVDFVANYTDLQPILSLHAQTQPPGAVLTIYVLNLLLGSPDLIALAICAIATLFSAFFLDRIFEQFFEKDVARYGVLLFVLLPAVQVYYLANIYAIVAVLMFGSLYFYLHSNQVISIVGSVLFVFLGTFVSFLFVYIGIFMLVYESIKTGLPGERNLVQWMKDLGGNMMNPFIIVTAIGAIYGLLYITIGFNYIEAFLYASSLENPNGFMLFTDPGTYFMTRVQNILDIVIFFGPVLLYLCWKGLVPLREQNAISYQLVLAALVSLLLLFLTGAPKKGETARICLFFLPFLLIPVLGYIQEGHVNKRELVLLAMVVFIQAVITQILGNFIW
jgi:hypothetical protein